MWARVRISQNAVNRRQFLWMRPTGHLAVYARREEGGARLARRMDVPTSAGRGSVGGSCLPSPTSPSEVAAETTAGRFCQRLCQTEALSPAVWETLRLPGEDSSISARMACRSSEAEITGNNRTNTQPRAQRKTTGRTDGLCAEFFAGRPETAANVLRRHRRQAGKSSESQQRLRKSSIT
jgi:hypothetical protein